METMQNCKWVHDRYGYATRLELKENALVTENDGQLER